jgi:small conductance mechanosensitive channel
MQTHPDTDPVQLADLRHLRHAGPLALRVGTRAARHARREVIILVPLLVALGILDIYRAPLFGEDVNARLAIGMAILIVGSAIARDMGRLAGPPLLDRVSPETAGPLDFALRALGLVAIALAALSIAGVSPSSLAGGGALGVVVLGLAAQQTLGNLMAGLVLMVSRPLRIGDVVRIQGGMIAGSVEGTVASMGLWSVVLSNGEDNVLVPNSAVLAGAVMPQREPHGVAVRVSLATGVALTDLQTRLGAISVPTRNRPHIQLEEMSTAGVVVRISAVPASAGDGGRLADQILGALQPVMAPQG